MLPPPRARAVDEDTGWFLDHFSPGELRRVAAPRRRRRRARRVARRRWRRSPSAAGASLLVATQVTSFEVDPGALPVLAIVGAGFSFAVFVFHLLRLRAARELARGAVSLETVRAHLDVGVTPVGRVPDPPYDHRRTRGRVGDPPLLGGQLLRRVLAAGAQELDDRRQHRDDDDRQDDEVEVALHHRHVAEEVAGEGERRPPRRRRR